MRAVPHGNFSNPRLVVIGCGYVGTAVAELAQTQGVDVAALTRNVTAAAGLRARGIRAVVADAASDAWHRELNTPPEFVLNCLSGGGGGLDEYRHSYLGGMESVLRWAAGLNGVGTIVYTSSTSVYPHAHGVTVDESTLPVTPGCGLESSGGEPGDRATRARILVDAERKLAASEAACRRWFILRLAGIYGPGRHYLIDQIRSGVAAGVGEHRLNLAHRDDIARAIWACFSAGPEIANEVFNVADDGAAPKAEIVEWLARKLGVNAPELTGEPAAARRSLTPDRIISNRKLKSTLGWRPKYPTFREGYEAILGP